MKKMSKKQTRYQHKDVLQLLSPCVFISHCVAMDEAHEMKINKGTKQLAGRPTEETCIHVDHFP